MTISDKYPILLGCPLFADITGSDINVLSACLSAKERHYRRNEVILPKGDKPEAIGVILSGSVSISKEDFFGGCNIIAEIYAGGVFGEAHACAGTEHSPVTVTAKVKSAVLFLDYTHIIAMCPSVCSCHAVLVKNMLRTLADNNIALTDKLEHITRRNMREKVMSYLSSVARQHKSSEFTIPYNRRELAGYLSVERSALSAQLSRLRNEGIIEFKKNKFKLSNMDIADKFS